MLMAGSNGLLYNLQTDGAYDTALMPLPTFHYDKGRTGWHRLSPTGVEERPVTAVRRAWPTIVRGVLSLPVAGRRSPAALIDACGRKVLDLQPGLNDVRHLGPGIYFMRAIGTAEATRLVMVD
jgi:hypothetical protein